MLNLLKVDLESFTKISRESYEHEQEYLEAILRVIYNTKPEIINSSLSEDSTSWYISALLNYKLEQPIISFEEFYEQEQLWKQGRQETKDKYIQMLQKYEILDENRVRTLHYSHDTKRRKKLYRKYRTKMKDVLDIIQPYESYLLTKCLVYYSNGDRLNLQDLKVYIEEQMRIDGNSIPKDKVESYLATFIHMMSALEQLKMVRT